MLAAGKRSLTALALDYDAKGAATVSGFAAPAETVELRVDGVERGQAVADQAGRFVALAHRAARRRRARLRPGRRRRARARFSAAIGPASPVSGAPYAARREGGGWRIDWITPGGGEQTTLIFDAGAGGGGA